MRLLVLCEGRYIRGEPGVVPISMQASIEFDEILCEHTIARS